MDAQALRLLSLPCGLAYDPNGACAHAPSWHGSQVAQSRLYTSLATSRISDLTSELEPLRASRAEANGEVRAAGQGRAEACTLRGGRAVLGACSY